MNLVKTELIAWYKVDELPKCPGRFLAKDKNWQIYDSKFDGINFYHNSTLLENIIEYAPFPRG